MKKNIQVFLLITVFLTIVLTNIFPALADSNSSSEVKKYIKMLENPSAKRRIYAAKRITRAELKDPGLFNLINVILLNGYNTNSGNRTQVEEMAWMCKALATSGSSKYIHTLKKISQTANNRKLKNYAKKSLVKLSEHALKKKFRSDRKNINPNLSMEVNQFIRMLRSDIINLQRNAAKSIYKGQFNEEPLFDALSSQLLKQYNTVSLRDRNQLDTLAWMCKALGTSGMVKYKHTFEKIINTSSNSKLKKYARQGLKMLK